jgi:hypothetical protein
MTSLIRRFLGVFNPQGESSMTNYIARHHVTCFRPQRVEPMAAAMLSDKEQIPLGELAEQLAESLYRDELRHGRWAVDVGLLRPNVFIADVLQELQSGGGDLGKIDKSE